MISGRQNWYEGSAVGASNRRHLFTNWQSLPRARSGGSITAITDSAGAAIGVNAYDAYGIPNDTNIGRFQYTGQMWIAELGLYHYKALAYSPTLGRFMQTDPIGYEDQYNLYGYVGNDPVMRVDPTGLECGLVVGDDGTTDFERRGGRCDDPPGPDLWVLSSPREKYVTLVEVPVKKTGGNPDYCGSKGSERVPDGIWGEACRKHDECYAKAGTSKEKCDLQLAEDITRVCTSKGGGPACAIVGAVYGAGLVLLGWKESYVPVTISGKIYWVNNSRDTIIPGTLLIPGTLYLFNIVLQFFIRLTLSAPLRLRAKLVGTADPDGGYGEHVCAQSPGIIQDR